MGVLYGEGLASHSGPESCVCDRKVVGEALTGGAASRDIEPRKSHKEQDASAVQVSEGQHRINRPGKVDMWAFRLHVGRLWMRTLKRRSQRSRIDWSRMTRIIDRWLPCPRVLHAYPEQRLRVTTRGRSPVR